MDLAQAMMILADVCRQFRGTLMDHERIQAALGIVSQEIELKRNLIPTPAPIIPDKPE